MMQDGKTSIALVAAGECRIESSLNLGGDDSDTVTFDGVTPFAIKPAPDNFDITSLLLMGAVVRSLQIAGSLEAMLDISVKIFQRTCRLREEGFRSFRRSNTTSPNSPASRPLHSRPADVGGPMLLPAARLRTLRSWKRRRQKSAVRKPPKRQPQLPIRSMARSASPSSTSCIAIRCGRWLGATISAPKVFGRLSLANASPKTARTNVAAGGFAGEFEHDPEKWEPVFSKTIMLKKRKSSSLEIRDLE